MSAVMKTRIIKIGNSQGIRIPKPLLDQSGLGSEVELTVRPGRLVIRAPHRPRHGWDEQFRAMAERGDDKLLDGELLRLTEWEQQEWEWLKCLPNSLNG
jgi:antitoxin MazE